MLLSRIVVPAEVTEQFHGFRVFMKLDLSQGCIQVPFHPASRDLTAFVTHAGVFRHTCIPGGLSSAPSCFQVMSTILAGISRVAIYLDGIVIHSQDLHIYDQRLHKVFRALLQNNLTLNGEKCTCTAPVVELVGFYPVGQRGGTLQPSAEEPHQDAPGPGVHVPNRPEPNTSALQGMTTHSNTGLTGISHARS
jgi:hypothetical protein